MSMRLSEAIRLGATMKPKESIFMISDRGTCAYGAALDAIGFTRFEITVRGMSHIVETWQATLAAMEATPCPACNARAGGIGIVPHLNDAHNWSREQIADFVELHELQAMTLDPIVTEEVI